MISGFATYQIYMATQLHLTGKYDLFKYGVNAKRWNIEAYQKRNDQHKFESLGHKVYKAKVAIEFCAANFVHGKQDWLYHEISDANDVYHGWRGYLESFAYRFKTEFNIMQQTMTERSMTFDDMVSKTASGNHAPLLQMLIKGYVTPEFILKLDEHKLFLDGWVTEYDSDPFIKKRLHMITKYRPLFNLFRKRLSAK